MSEKKRRRRYSETLKREAGARMRDCPKVTALTRELGMDPKSRYEWKWREEGRANPKAQPLTRRAAQKGSLESLGRENAHLKRRLAEKALEVDFFKGALPPVEARRRSRRSSGETPSTRASMSGRSPGKAD